MSEPTATSPGAEAPWLVARGVTKSFGAARALRSVDLELRPGEIRALLGANGSGKSTFVKTLGGYHAADAGEVRVDGRPVDLLDPQARAGFRFVHQDLGLIAQMTVAENLALTGGAARSSLARVRRRAEHRRFAAMLERYGVRVAPHEKVERLTPPERTMVAFIRCLHAQEGRPRLLVLDEVTATLPTHEIQDVFAAVRRVAAEGASVLVVTHRVQEVMDLCDTATVFRDGAVVATLPVAGLTEHELVEHIVGRPVQTLYHVLAPSGRAVALEVQGLSGGAVDDVSLTLHEGEIVGLASIDPASPRDLLRMLFHARARSSGSIALGGAPVPARARPRDVVSRGMGLVAGRQEAGVATFTLRENLTLSDVGSLMRGGRLDRREEHAVCAGLIEDFQIDPPRPEAPFSAFSGGNQQKAIVARAMRLGPSVLLLDEPTQGVDVGAKAALYALWQEAAGRGVAMLLASSDMEELCGVCHRVIVLKDGRVSAIVQGSALTAETLLERCYVEADGLTFAEAVAS